MKWIVLCCLLWARRGDGGALKCSADSEDLSCTSKIENEEKVAEVPRNPELSASETAKVESECLAGTEWDSNCHHCWCSEGGVAECLKKSLCDIDTVSEEPIRCKPNTTFERDCNTCMCLENGHILCTLAHCQKSSKILPSGKECASGSAWQSQCNDCACSPQGYSFCTEKACLDKLSEPQLRCAPGTLWKNDCNTCWCSSLGLAMCTKIGCGGFISELNFSEKVTSVPETREVIEPNVSLSRRSRAAPPESPKTCQPGQEFRMDCNKCLCDNEGQDFSCTRIDCTALNNNNGGSRRKRDTLKTIEAKCAPGSVFNKDCNVCRCTTDGGHASCTLKRCEQASLISNTTTTESSFRCSPGEQFKLSCSDCTCSADGKSYFCTLVVCNDELIP